MKRPITLAICVILFVLLVSGCIKSDGKISLNSDGTIGLKATLVYKKQFLQQLVDAQGGGDLKSMLDIKGLFDQVAERDLNNYPDIVYLSNEVEDDEYLGIGVNVTYPNAEAFTKSELRMEVIPPLGIDPDSKEVNASFLTAPNAFGTRYTLNSKLDLTSLTQGQEINPDDKAFEGLSARLAIEVPQSAALFVKHNAQSVENGRVYVWEAKPNEPAEIAFTVFVPGMTALIGTIGALLILLAIILLIVFLARRRPKPEFYYEPEAGAFDENAAEGEHGEGAGEENIPEGEMGKDALEESAAELAPEEDAVAEAAAEATPADEDIMPEDDVDKDEMPEQYEAANQSELKEAAEEGISDTDRDIEDDTAE